MKPDAVQELLKVVMSVVKLDDDTLSKADSAIRKKFGGSTLRIKTRAPVTIEQIDKGLRQSKPVAVIASEVGLSRVTIYRMLGRKSRKNNATATPKTGK